MSLNVDLRQSALGGQFCIPISRVRDVGPLGAAMSFCVHLIGAMGLLFFGLTAHAQMTVPGQFAVVDGAVNYTIPIQAPPGAAGLQPSLSISYSSQSSNGLVGQGWTLSGLSSISRCPRTKAQDGILTPVSIKYDLTDRYCIDGQRLIAVSGDYGATGTEYRTERESFLKVISLAETNATGGPGSFVVKNSAGLTMEYGETTDSRIESQGKTAVAIWALNKVYDSKGNYYTISYAEDSATGSWRPVTIEYTGNAAIGAPTQTITFEYESRPDIVFTYMAGSKYSHQLRLRQVTMSNGKFYRLTYGATEITAHSRLSKVEYCVAVGNCLPATTFTYSPGENFSTPTMLSPIATTDLNGNVGAVLTGDWNGDGHTDMMWYDPSSGNNRWYVSGGSLSFTRYLNPINATAINGGGGVVYTGDWNGDGIQDLLWYNRNTGDNRWFIGSGAMTFLQYNNLISPASLNGNIGGLNFEDWNGDGRTDVMWYDAGTGQNRWFISNGAIGGAPSFTAVYTNPIATNTINAGSGIFFGDWNGDGITDFMWFNSTTGENRWFTANGDMTFSYAPNLIATSDVNTGGNIVFGDWNSDGITDMLWYNKAGDNRWFVGNGASGFTKYVNPIAPASINGVGPLIRVGDWNGDGRVDVLWYDPSNGNNRWLINDGAMHFSQTNNPIAASAVNGSQGNMYFGDFNGNGITDILFYSADTGTNRWYLNQGSPGQDLTQIDPGLGAASKITVTSSALTELWGTQYYKEFTPAYPKLALAIPMRVVKSSTSPDGVGGTRTTTYSYGNLLNEVDGGRGLLGFQWVQSKDVSTGVVSRTYYRQDWPYLGLVEKSGKGTNEANWSNLGLSTNEYKFMAFTASDANYASAVTCADDPATGKTEASCAASAIKPLSRYVPYAAKSVNKAWDWDSDTGVFIALPQSRTTTVLDSWGNATQVKAETLNADGTASGYSKTTDSVFAPADAANWRLGRLSKSSVTATAP